MPHPTIKSYDSLMAQAVATVVARTELSDVSDTGIAKHLLAIGSRQLSEFYYQLLLMKNLFSIDRASGDDLDERAKDIQPGTLTRRLAVLATGTVVFSRSGTTGTTSIVTGTKVKTVGGIEFSTTAAGSITPSSPEIISGHGTGRDVEIAVIASVGGTAGNVVSGTITKFAQTPPGTNEVTNLDPTLYGLDQETDDSFRKRLKAWVSSLARSTILSLETAVTGAVDPDTGAEIRFSKAFEDQINRGYVTLYIDDGNGTASQTTTATDEEVTPEGGAVGGETRLWLDHKPIATACVLTSSTRSTLTEGVEYTLNRASGQLMFEPALVETEVIDADYTYYIGLVALAQKIVDGDPNDPTNYPGYRAAGVLVTVESPQVLVQNVEVLASVEDGYDGETVREAVAEALKVWINGLSISDDVLMQELVREVMQVPGVHNCQFVLPTADVVMLDDQLARTSDNNIEVR